MAALTLFKQIMFQNVKTNKSWGGHSLLAGDIQTWKLLPKEVTEQTLSFKYIYFSTALR